MSDDTPRIVFPSGLTTKEARRVADIGDALTNCGLQVEALVDASLYAITEEQKAAVGLGLCEGCGCRMEYGHCYCCLPVSGYGEGFFERRHPKGISHAGGALGVEGEQEKPT